MGERMPKRESSAPMDEMPAETVIQVVPVGPVVHEEPATLDAAFMLLCRAMMANLEEDVPSLMHVEEIMGWYVNGNHAIAWTHAVDTLGRVVGVSFSH